MLVGGGGFEHSDLTRVRRASLGHRLQIPAPPRTFSWVHSITELPADVPIIQRNDSYRMDDISCDEIAPACWPLHQGSPVSIHGPQVLPGGIERPVSGFSKMVPRGEIESPRPCGLPVLSRQCLPASITWAIDGVRETNPEPTQPEVVRRRQSSCSPYVWNEKDGVRRGT